jgi:hypothetical protein
MPNFLMSCAQTLAASIDFTGRLGLIPVVLFLLILLIHFVALVVTGRDTAHRRRLNREIASRRRDENERRLLASAVPVGYHRRTS